MAWIWKETEEQNSFAEFLHSFEYHGGRAELSISADFQYAAYIGDAMVSCGQYADLPTYKCFNIADITKYLKEGKNALRVIAWHMGHGYSICRPMTAAVSFAIKVNGNTIAESGEDTLCRSALGYRNGDRITPQLGQGFFYDFRDEGEERRPARVVETGFSSALRPIKNNTVGDVPDCRIVAQGFYKYRGGNTCAERLQQAFMSSMRFKAMTGRYRVGADILSAPIAFAAPIAMKEWQGDGLFIIADMGRETCGHLSFTVSVDTETKMYLGWGEHLSDLRVRTNVGNRNFAIEFDLKAGENVFDDYLLRFGCRYITLFVESERFSISRLGIREVGYPFNYTEKSFGDRLLDKIYETGRRTLYLSAHQHYEDCPWREQALYGMDSRNQMLFGYGAFGEYEYPRANMMLIARSMQANGLIAMTSPSEQSITIPSFTAHWLIAIAENGEADYNEEFLREIMPYAKRGMEALLGQEGENGLSLFCGVDAWNFHEWRKGLDGHTIFRKEEIAPQADAGLTALTAIALSKLSPILSRLGEEDTAKEWKAAAKRLTLSLENYYNKENGFYASYIDGRELVGYHEYIQALIIIAHMESAAEMPEARREKLFSALRAPSESGLVPATLSALQFTYQALIDGAGDIDHCVEEVVRIFGKMLFEGATSYYETELGEADFADAGSLCHGWSAVCCWVLDRWFALRGSAN